MSLKNLFKIQDNKHKLFMKLAFISIGIYSFIFLANWVHRMYYSYDCDILEKFLPYFAFPIVIFNIYIFMTNYHNQNNKKYIIILLSITLVLVLYGVFTEQIVVLDSLLNLWIFGLCLYHSLKNPYYYNKKDNSEIDNN